MRIAIVHDDLVQFGGAERVLEALCEIYPDAPIFTSVFDYSNNQLQKRFAQKKIITSFLQQIPGWKLLYKKLLPFYPIAFEQFNFDGFDLVISHTTRFAKSVLTKPQTKHICYCHTPPRFLWHFSGEGNYSFWELLMTKLRIYDTISARRVDAFLAGSENAKKRIKRVYRVDSEVVYPFVDIKKFIGVDSFNGGYFLVLGRASKYKRFDLALEACRNLDVELKIVTGGLSDEMVANIIAGCKALIIPGIEDFGIASLEAQALGKPVIAFDQGGSLETVIEGKTGLFFNTQSVESLTDAIQRLDAKKINPQDCIDNARRFSKEKFISRFKQEVSTLVYSI